MAAVLDGVRVVDLTQLVAGPVCTLLLGDLGAEVLKLEPPAGEAARHLGSVRVGGESDYFLSCNRNKKSVVVDLKTPRGIETVRALIRGADVLVENFRPGTMEKLGLGYEALAGDNPGLVYCAIAGFHGDGAYRDKPALDPVVQAMSGVMQLTGTPETGPLRTGFLLSDFVPPLIGTVGVLAALYERRSSGRGQRVDVSMMDATVFSMISREGYYFATGQTPARLGNAHFGLAPYNTYRTSDARHLMVIAHDQKYWKLLLEGLGRPDLAEDPRFRTNADRVRERAAIDAVLAGLFAQRTLADWCARLDAADALYAPVRTWEEVFSDPEIRDGMLATVQHPVAGEIRVLRAPLRLSRTPTAIRLAPPQLGQHTDEVLGAAAPAPRAPAQD